MKKMFTRRLLALTLSFILAVPLISGAVCAAAPDGNVPDIGLTREERELVSSVGEVRVGYVQDRPPVSFTGESGTLEGMSRYIFDQIARLTGLNFQYVPLPAGAVTYDYLTGESIDLVTSVERNSENENARGILISEPYLKSRKVIVAREDLDFNMEDDLTVAVSSGSQTLRKALHAAYPQFELTDYDSIPDCFDAVLSGGSDLMILNQYVVEYWFSKPAYESLKVIPVMGLDEQLCFSAIVTIDGTAGASQERGEALIGIINKAIGAIPEDYTSSVIIRAAMENQYDLTLGDFVYRYRAAVAVFFVSAAAILALILLLAWQRMRSAEASAEARAKGRFLSAMSHEIRTPLNGLIGLNYLMEQKLDDRERMEKYLRQSTATARYLLRLVSDILDMSTLREHGVELMRAPVDMEMLVNSLRALAGPGMEEKGIEFTASARLECPFVEGDEARIEQVVLSLLDNARKFTPSGGRVELLVTQRLIEDDMVMTSVTVSDTGKGMSEEFKQKIFNAFSQELDTVSKGNQGTGLGLAISHELASLMGGELTFDSEKDVGSTFVFSFPGAVLPAPAAPEPDETESAGGADSRRRVLIAEDNELNLEIMTELLTEDGFETVPARDGKEALDAFAASAPGSIGIILMDLLMPNMDGYESARAIRALDREDARTVRIIACTANTFPDDRRRAFEAGMDDFIPKPVDVGELMEKLVL